jgi:hypothetical protein
MRVINHGDNSRLELFRKLHHGLVYAKWWKVGWTHKIKSNKWIKIIMIIIINKFNNKAP